MYTYNSAYTLNNVSMQLVYIIASQMQEGYIPCSDYQQIMQRLSANHVTIHPNNYIIRVKIRTPNVAFQYKIAFNVTDTQETTPLKLYYIHTVTMEFA